MRTIHSSRTTAAIAFLLLAVVAGCKDEPETANPAATGGAGGSASAGGGAAPAEADVVGLWRVTTVEGGSTALFPKDMLDSIKSGTTLVNADHTFLTFNDAAGQYRGKWSLDGSTLTLTPEPKPGQERSSFITSKPAVEGGRLVNRSETGTTTIYEKQPLPADDAKPAFTLTVEEMLAEAKADAAARKVTAGALVEVDGVVSAIQEGGSGDASVTVSAPPKEGAGAGAGSGGVTCLTAEKEPWADVAVGQKVKVRGYTHVARSQPALYFARFTTLGEPVAATVTAEQFVEEWAKDAAAAKKKYMRDESTGKTVILSGKIVGKNPAEGDPSGLLVGDDSGADGKGWIVCRFGGDFDTVNLLKGLKVGDQVKLVGEFDRFSATDEPPTIGSCKLITK